MTSTIKVQNIKHTNDTTAMAIDSSGRTRLQGNPCFGVRGVASSSGSNPGSYDSSYREVTGWTTTEVNRGGMIVNGRMRAPVNGVYQIFHCSSANPSFTSQHRMLAVFKVAGGTWSGSASEELHRAWSGSDYGRYTLAFYHVLELNAGDEVSVGWHSSHPAHTDDAYTSFSGMLIG
tara:strand:- start:30 stop:557 length:528 start_codon:yes stop_codon:yes gene_type:complete